MKTVYIVGLEEDEALLWNSEYYKIKTNEYSAINEPYSIGVDDYSCPKSKFTDKLNLYKEQDLICGKASELKDTIHDVWIKPRQNFYGLGYKAEHYNRLNPETIDVDEDFLYVEHFTGEHRSFDFILKNGEIIWNDCLIGVKDELFLFEKWVANSDVDFTVLHDFIYKHFPYYTGPLNIEMIGDNILEVHQRPANQYIDLYKIDYPTLLISTMFELEPKLIEKPISEPRISWVYWLENKEAIENITLIDSLGSLQSMYDIKPDIRCNQILGNSFRVAVVNTTGITERPKIEIQLLSNRTIKCNEHLTKVR